ncbi:MAG: protein-disulfide isomerase [Candidatus Saccharimonadales bacterium]|jgi:protein-disulfide isomerase
MKDLLPVLIVFILLVAGGAFFITNASSTTSEEASTQRASTLQQNNVDNAVKLTIGNPSAEATVVEYFDYKCPSCNSFHRTTGAEIEQNYVDTDLANIEVRITPIIGPDSANAGRGAYCALEQGLFEEYHGTVLDYMYDNYYSSGNFESEFQNILTTSTLASISEPLGIDTGVFTNCVDSDRFNSNLDNNLLLAADDEIQGTPGFAVGQQSFVGGQPYSVFKTLLDIELR